jgi:3'(2'), 5'-bisphosphate nucleotidase
MASHKYADDPRNAAFIARHKVARVVNIGSAEKFCRVAEGTADLYPRFGATMEWDTAAPEALVLAAGGVMADWAGAPLRYGKPGWTNPGFLVAGRA